MQEIHDKQGVKRRRFLIDTHAQGRFLIMTLLYLVIFSFLLIIIILFPGYDHLMHDGFSAIDSNLRSEMGAFILERLIPALVIYLFLVAFHSIVMTHRIFGPIYRIEQRMIEAIQGNFVDTIHFRKNDFLRGLDITINRVFLSISERLESIIQEEENLTDNLDRLLTGVQTGNIPLQNVAMALKAVQQRQEKINDELRAFKSKKDSSDGAKEIPIDSSIYL